MSSTKTAPIDGGGSIVGTLVISQVGLLYQSTAPNVQASLPLGDMTVVADDCDSGDFYLARLFGVLRQSGECYNLFSSFAAFDSMGSMRFDYTDVDSDTTTLSLFYFDGVSWSSSGITNQTVSLDTTTQIITIAGEISHSGVYAAMFEGQDSSAPVTSFAIDGSSFVFNGTVFASTDAFVVLAASDPVVDGFASGVATTYYRVDGSASDPFFVYTDSVPMSVGTHFFAYYSVDYAGNIEAVQTATFTVTDGDTLFAKESLYIGDGALIGYIDSGAQFEAEAAAQNDYVISLTSANEAALMRTDNIGNTSIGEHLAEATLDIAGLADSADIALQLRAGNSTGAASSYQLALASIITRRNSEGLAHSKIRDITLFNTI
jgi:hypothetical protein